MAMIQLQPMSEIKYCTVVIGAVLRQLCASVFIM